jgi:P27 family predicted phage terminase small subunit
MGSRGRKSAAELRVIRSDPEPKSPQPPSPPSHLGAPEQQLWADIHRDFSFDTKAAVAVLRTALEAHQRARECRERIACEGMTVEGRDGQVKVHPLVAAERDSRAAWLSAIKSLGLEL